MDGSPRLVSRTANLIPVKSSPFDRDVILAQAARISAIYLDRSEQKVRRGNVGEDDSLRNKIKKLSLFPNNVNRNFVTKYSDATS